MSPIFLHYSKLQQFVFSKSHTKVAIIVVIPPSCTKKIKLYDTFPNFLPFLQITCKHYNCCYHSSLVCRKKHHYHSSHTQKFHTRNKKERFLHMLLCSQKHKIHIKLQQPLIFVVVGNWWAIISTLCISHTFHFSPYVLASISTKDGTMAPYTLNTTLVRIIQIEHKVLSKLSFECFGLLYHLKIHQGEGAPPISCHYRWGIFSYNSSCPKFSSESSFYLPNV